MKNQLNTHLDLMKKKYSFLPDSMSLLDSKIGIELEFPIIAKDGSKPNFDLLKNILNILLPKLGFETIEEDFSGNSIKGKNNAKDLISFESCYGIIELSLHPEKDLHAIESKSNYLINAINLELSNYGLTLLDSGINPYPWALELPIIENDYYSLLYSIFKKFNLQKPYSHEKYNVLMCASQVHLDVDKNNIPILLNILKNIGWIKALLFSNSPKKIDNNINCLCFRDLLWNQNSWAYFPENVGIKDEEYSNINDVFNSLLNNTIFFVKRNNDFIYFSPLPLREFLNKTKIQGWIHNKNDELIYIKPEWSDVDYCRPYNHAVITTRGTVEIRSECQQPFNDILAPAAFHLGLINNLEEILAYINSITIQHAPSMLRDFAIYGWKNIEEKISINIYNHIREILLLIKKGLSKRNLNEENYLNCLFNRLDNKTNPADKQLKTNK